MKFTLATATLLLATFAAFAADPRVDALIEGMKTGEESRLVLAKQRMPYLDPVASAEALAGLLSHENERVWRTAYNLLADACNVASAPGREAERDAVTGVVMGLLDLGRSTHEKEQALRLLPQVLPEGYGLSPVVVLLRGDDAHLRERARAALIEAGTTGAAAALKAGLADAPEEFQVALLDGLAAISDDRHDELTAYVEKASPAVAIAAARALAASGSLDYLPHLGALVARVPEEAKEEAARAGLTLLNRAAANGGNWEVVIAALAHLAASAPTAEIKGAALVSLGRYGSAREIGQILATGGSGEDLSLAGPAIRALDYQHGRAAREALLEHYPNAPTALKPALLALFGRKQDEGFLPILVEEAQNADAAVRGAALEALSNSGRPEAIAPLVVALEQDMAIAKAYLQRVAKDLRAKNAAQAGNAYVALYTAAENDEERADALQGIRQFPVPEAYDIVAGAVGKEELASFPPAALAGVARALKGAQREEEAREVFALLLARLAEPEFAREAIALGPEFGMAEEIRQRLGILDQWHIAGPFPWKSSDGFTAEGIDQNAPALGAPLVLGEASAPWKAVTTEDPMGLVNLAGELGMQDGVRAYAHTSVEVSEEVEAELRLGSDDGIAVWLNGELVFENNVDRGFALDQDQVTLKLAPGMNTLLLEITQGGGGWAFGARLLGKDGASLPLGPPAAEEENAPESPAVAPAPVPGETVAETAPADTGSEG